MNTKNANILASPTYPLKSYGVVYLLLAAVVAFIIPTQTIVEYVPIPAEGDVASSKIVAPFTFDVLKPPGHLEEERRIAREKTLAVFNYDEILTEKAYTKMESLGNDLHLLRNPFTPDSAKNAAQARLGEELSQGTMDLLVKEPRFLEDVKYSADRLFDGGVLSSFLARSPVDLDHYKQQFNLANPTYMMYEKDYLTMVRDSIQITTKTSSLLTKEAAVEKEIGLLREKHSTPEVVEALSEVLYAFVVPNVFHNPTETMRQQDLEMANVTPHAGKVIKGATIVEENGRITSEIVERLLSLNEAQRRIAKARGWFWAANPYITNYIVSAVLLMCFAVILRTLLFPLFASPRKFLSLSGLFVFCLLLTRLSMILGDQVTPPLETRFLLPYFVGAGIASLTFGLPAALLLNLFLSIFCGILLRQDFGILLFVLLVGSFVAWVLTRVRRPAHFLIAPFPILGTVTVYLLLLFWIKTEINSQRAVELIQVSAICALGSFLVTLLFPLFERISGRLSQVSLHRYSQLNHPLLHRLSVEAPGTFQHSMNVANLTSAAALAIGENPLLARILGFYHDVGKIPRAQAFSENQGPGAPPIPEVEQPAAYRSMIAAHVREGSQLAAQYRLPSVVIDSILQHHGTNPVLTGAPNPEMDSQEERVEFLYPGPRPKTKLNALVMVSDGVEMAMRQGLTSMAKENMHGLARRIITELVVSGQLDNNPITMKELNRARDAILPVMVRAAGSTTMI